MTAAAQRPPVPVRADYPFFTTIQTRWSDNDMFGHVNNVAYYRFFEIAVVDFLAGPVGVNMLQDPVVPFAAESLCRFRKALSFPETVEAGLRVEHIGNSSVRYGIGLFRQGENEPAAHGHWVHVFVERATEIPAPIPDAVRAAFERHRTPSQG